MARRPFTRRKKSCPFSGPNAPVIDYKDTKLLSRFGFIAVIIINFHDFSLRFRDETLMKIHP